MVANRSRHGLAPERLETRELLASFLVLNVNDSGAGSLRQAIIDSNATPGANDIGFALSGSAPFTIAPMSALPAITNTVSIGGAGPDGKPTIALDGANAGSGASGLDIRANNCRIDGLAIGGFDSRGIVIEGASGTLVRGNYIGTDATGTSARPNGGAGIELIEVNPPFRKSVSNNTIGGTKSIDGNLVAFNRGEGIVIRGGFDSRGNRILGNSIYGNTGIGIDLGGDGVTRNPVEPTGGGPNSSQPFPVVTSATSGSSPAVRGTLTSGHTGDQFRVEFFASETPDATGYGQGRTYLGFTTVTVNSLGTGRFSFFPEGAVAGGSYITATATDPNGNTSEFSQAFLSLAPSPGTIQFESATYSMTESRMATITVTRTGGTVGTVSVGYATSDGTALAGSDYLAKTGTITFEDGDATPQTFTISPISNLTVEPIETFSITLSGIDGATLGATSSTVVTIIDSNTAGIDVNASLGLTTTEAGGTARFGLFLKSRPTANVTITLTSSNPAEGTVSPTTVTFTPNEFNTPKYVTITGVDDALADGDVAYTIVTSDIVSDDPFYNGLAVADVDVVNLDDDTPGVTVSRTAGLVTTEAGGASTFSLRLNSKPTANVTIALASSNTAEGTVGPATLVFTPANWATPQVVTVTGVDDDTADGSAAYTIVTSATSSADPSYHGLAVPDVGLSNTDDDTARIVATALTSTLGTAEAGSTDTFTVRLTSRPTAQVMIPLGSTKPGEGVPDPSFLIFTPSNWNVPQTVTVRGVADQTVDGPTFYTIITGTAVSDDPVYNGLDADDFLVYSIDTDVAGIIVAPTSGLVTTEMGVTATFSVRLDTRPTSDVVVPLRTSNPAEGVVTPAFLLFTPSNWDVPQAVTVSGADDPVADGNVAHAVVIGPAQSADPSYNNLGAPDVGIVNIDDDEPGIAVIMTSPPTTTAGGAATLAILLRSRPISTVAVNVVSTDPAQGTVSPSVLIFTPDNWNLPQSVSVVGSGRNRSTGSVAYTVTATASSIDPRYNDLNTAPVAMININLPPVTVSGVRVVTVKAKKSRAQAIAVGFGRALNAGSAINLGNYRLIGAGRDRRFGTRDDVRLNLASASYDAATNTVTLSPNRKVSLTSGPVQLRVIGAGLLDGSGRPVDGNRDGRVGGDLLATINKKRVTLS
ncbi:Calx-beta domain-containing protein [Tundrisphaera sp. TA3]|uniref:Calx-beta domain-containing protein n=1 Tax=Tundrisphaera sp. TA3 TaxID=3435775 RepID=UPI003EB7E4F2